MYHQPAGEAGDAHLPEIDIDDLFGNAPIVIEQIRGVAKATSSSADLMALGALAAASSALARKVEIHPGDGGTWTPNPHLYVVVEATSGAGKGPMTKQMGCLGAIKKWQADLVARHEADVRDQRLDREILKDERLDKFRALKKAAPTDKARLKGEIHVLDDRLAEPAPPRAAPAPGTSTRSPRTRTNAASPTTHGRARRSCPRRPTRSPPTRTPSTPSARSTTATSPAPRAG